jgi:hypothetical protein
MMTVFDEWLSRKMARNARTIRMARTVVEEFTRNYSTRNAFARIVLMGEPSDVFEFRSSARWPMEPELYNGEVLDGILDELLATGIGSVVTRIRCVLGEIGWHEVDSSPNAFYQAARAATRKLIEDNVVLPGSPG